MMNSVTFYKGSENAKLTVTVLDQDGNAVDLTGGSVTLIIEGINGADLSIGGSLTSSPAAGECMFTLNTTGSGAALAVKGSFQAQVKAVTSLDTVMSKAFQFNVE